MKTEGARGISRQERERQGKQYEVATEGWFSAVLQGAVLKTVFLNALPYQLQRRKSETNLEGQSRLRNLTQCL